MTTPEFTGMQRRNQTSEISLMTSSTVLEGRRHNNGGSRVGEQRKTSNP